MSGGTMKGRSSTGSISSANRVRTAIALKIVPTVTNPSVASAVTPMMPGRAAPRSTLKKSTKRGSVTASTVPTKARLASSFPAKSASRGTGASSSPSSAAFSCSMVNARLSASIAASANVTHSTLGARSTAASAVGSRAKLNTTSTSAANTTAERIAVRLRSSARTSLPAMTSASLSQSGTDQHLVAGKEVAERPGQRLVARPSPVHHHGDPRRSLPGFGELVGDQHNAESLPTSLVELGPKPPAGRGIERGERLVQQQQPGPVQQRPGDRRALRQPPAEPPGRLVGARPEPRLVERGPGGCQRRRQAVESRGEGQVLHQAEIVVEQRLVGDQAHRPSDIGGVAAERPPLEPHVPPVGPGEPGEHPEQGGLAGAVRPHHRDRLAGGDGEIEIAKHLTQPVGAPQSPGLHQAGTVRRRHRCGRRARRDGRV